VVRFLKTFFLVAVERPVLLSELFFAELFKDNELLLCQNVIFRLTEGEVSDICSILKLEKGVGILELS